jgi:hypothetical protein
MGSPRKYGNNGDLEYKQDLIERIATLEEKVEQLSKVVL